MKWSTTRDDAVLLYFALDVNQTTLSLESAATFTGLRGNREYGKFVPSECSLLLELLEFSRSPSRRQMRLQNNPCLHQYPLDQCRPFPIPTVRVS